LNQTNALRVRGVRALLSTSLLLSCGLVAARAQYKDYAKADGPAQAFGGESHKWGIDGEVRGRSEDQTAINYLSGMNETYELTRVRGGLTAAGQVADRLSPVP
jgi:hypothetical protein